MLVRGMPGFVAGPSLRELRDEQNSTLRRRMHNCVVDVVEFLDCQTLLGRSPPCHGWLRRKTALHKCGDVLSIAMTGLSQLPTKLTQIVPWDKKFVVLHDDVIFIFKEETSKKPEKILRVREFKGIEAVESEAKDVPWPFRLLRKEKKEKKEKEKERERERDELFAAMSKDERQKWLKSINDMMEDDSDYEYPVETSPVRRKTRGPLPNIPGAGNSFEYDDLESVSSNSPVNNNSNNSNNNSNNSNSSSTNNSNNNNNNKILSREKSGINPQASMGKSAKIPVPPLPPVPGQQNIRKPVPPVLPVSPLIVKKITVKPPPPPPQDKLIKKAPIKPPEKKDKPALPSSVEREAQQVATPPPDEEYSEADGLIYEIQEDKQAVDAAMWRGNQEDAKNIMAKLCDKEGTYLLRVASVGHGYTMHVICGKRSVKFSIHEQDSTFEMGGKQFDSLALLVKHHKEEQLPNHDVKLTQPFSLIKHNRT